MTLRPSKLRSVAAICLTTALLAFCIIVGFVKSGPSEGLLIYGVMSVVIVAFLIYTVCRARVTLQNGQIEHLGYPPIMLPFSELTGFRLGSRLNGLIPAPLYLYHRSRPKSPICIRFLSDLDRGRLLDALGEA